MSGLSGIFGWFENRWIRQPLLLGPSEILNEKFFELNASAGNNVILGDTVPADEIWVVLSLAHLSKNTVNPGVNTGIKSAGVLYPTTGVSPSLLNEWHAFSVYLVLFPGNQIYGMFENCTLNDDLYCVYTGFKLYTGET